MKRIQLAYSIDECKYNVPTLQYLSSGQHKKNGWSESPQSTGPNTISCYSNPQTQIMTQIVTRNKPQVYKTAYPKTQDNGVSLQQRARRENSQTRHVHSYGTHSCERVVFFFFTSTSFTRAIRRPSFPWLSSCSCLYSVSRSFSFFLNIRVTECSCLVWWKIERIVHALFQAVREVLLICGIGEVGLSKHKETWHHQQHAILGFWEGGGHFEIHLYFCLCKTNIILH